MKILFCFILSSNLAFAECLNTSLDGYIATVSNESKVFRIKQLNHTLFYPEDSCGSKGCEIFIVSEVFPGCFVETLNKKAFLIEHTFTSQSLELKVNGQVKVLRYFRDEKRFR